MTVKELVDLLLETKTTNEVRVSVDGILYHIKDCDGDSVTTYITLRFD